MSVSERWSDAALQSLMRGPIQYGIVQTGVPTADGVFCVRVVDLTKSILAPTEMVRVTPAIHHSYRRTTLEPNDVLLALRGEIGAAKSVPDWLVGANIHRGVARLPCDTDKCVPQFVVHALGSGDVQLRIRRATNGSALRELTIAQLRRLRIPLPALGQQARISAILDKFESASAGIQSLVVLKRGLKKGLSEELLTGRRRFPRLRHLARAGCATEAGDPGQWHERPLSMLCTPLTRRNDANLSLVLTASGAHGLVAQRGYFTRRIAGEDLSSYSVLRRGEFAYNRSLMNGYPFGAIKRLIDHDEGLVSSLYLCFSVTNPNANPDFMAHVFESGILNPQLRRIVKVGARAHGLLNVSRDDFFSLRVALPPLSEQAEIARVLDLLDQEIDLLAQFGDALDRQRRAVAELLLTGKVRVPEVAT